MKWNCRKKKKIPQGGAILDQVISQSSSAENKCLLYKLANYKRGGDLIDAIQMGGQVAVEQLIKEQFGVFMYQNGRGQMINRAEYLRWKYSENHEVVIPIEASLSPHDPLSKWVDHKACWQMQYRGSLGESLLHVLIICDTKVHTKLARILVRVFPGQALDVMEGEEYLGASALHLAIAYSNNELVQDLIEAGANIEQRATGSFFLPRDQQGFKPAKNTDYEGLAYLGEYPLSWAACCANESVYNLLLEVGADPDAQDTFGNMILHMVVVGDKLDMFGYALRHPKTPARNGILNDAGLTPLTLACQLGRAEVFREMLELSAREFWRYSNITCSGYPLNALDTIMPDGSTNWNSALFIILDGTKEEHLDMLDGGIIQRLLEEKWKTFARNQFLKRLLILAVHLFCLSCSIYLRPAREIDDYDDDEKADLKLAGDDDEDGNEDADGDDETDISTYIRYGCECATIAGVLSYVILQQGDEIKNQGFKAFLKQLPRSPAKAIFLISNLMILACIPFRIMGDLATEESILVFAVPGSWFLLMFFAGAIRLTGPFVTMIFSMITGDMLTFGIIYMIVLFGFSQAFYFLYKGHPQVQQSLFSNYFSTWMALFQTTLGDYNYADLNNTTYPNLSKTVFVIFMIFVPILLLNMLIAMMGNTYAHVIEQSEKEWMKQWAKIVVTLERAVTQQDAQKYLEEYSIALGPSDDPRYEQRGVMVIKSKSKTRAKQRKGAVSNWKRVGKVTLNELKKRGITGEELRRLMWGRASITTPTKAPTKKKREMDDYGMGAALDVMSFTHDIVLCGDEEIPPVFIPGDIRANMRKADSKGMTNMLTQMQDSSVVPGTRTVPPQGKSALNVPATQKPAVKKEIPPTSIGKDYRDPLRELVLISDVPPAYDDANFMLNVRTLANDASSLEHIKEIDSVRAKQQLEEEQQTQNMEQFNLFQNPKDVVDPVKEREFMQTLEALEDTDSDPGEKPVLGKISLIRRAKSAVSRSSSAKKKTDKHPLFLIAWDDIDYQTTDIGVVNANYQEDEESFPAKEIEENNDITGNDEEEEPVTVEEVRRRMEEFHQKRKSSADSESTDRSKTSKHSKKRQTIVKGSRNKVSPEASQEQTKKEKRYKSAPSQETVARKQKTVERSDSPPDPLEPWSTKDIMNINKLLESDNYI